MFYVYSGFTCSDNFDCSEGPIFTLREFKTADGVAAAKKDFEDNLCEVEVYDNAIFRVFEGEEKQLIPKSHVIKWEIKK